jgi:hypothetical protein
MRPSPERVTSGPLRAICRPRAWRGNLTFDANKFMKATINLSARMGRVGYAKGAQWR